MSAFQIVCVETEHPHRHITHVGTGSNPDSASDRWTVEDVRRALSQGHRFYTVGPHSNRTADVKADTCNINGCLVRTIRSKADAIEDNNLDNLRVCHWKR